jgi:hypothetical protein
MLESRLLHKTVSRLRENVNWQDGPLIDWKYHGLEDELNFNLIHITIDKHLHSNHIYLIENRTNSKVYNRQELDEKLIEIIGKVDFSLWNLELTRIIEFNKIGVFRVGELELISQEVKDTFSYFDKIGTHFPSIKNELEEENIETVFGKMEIFAAYTNAQITTNNKSEIIRCFEFQENEYQNMNDLLLNALSVSYCEALLIGENSSVISEYVNIMPTNLKNHYLKYEEYYRNLSRNDY